MNFVRYELKSAPGTFIDIPEDYARKAEKVVKSVLESPADLPEPGDPLYFGNVGIWTRVISLAQNPASTSLQDAVYLRVCINQNEKNLSGLKQTQAAELDAALVRYVQTVESQK